MANIFKQYKDARTSAGLFTEPGSFPSALQSSATEGPRAGALDLHVSWIPAVAGYSCPTNFFFTRRTLAPWFGTDSWNWRFLCNCQYAQQINGLDNTSVPDLRAESLSAGISQTADTDATVCGEDVVNQRAWGSGASTESPDFEKLYTRYFEMWSSWLERTSLPYKRV